MSWNDALGLLDTYRRAREQSLKNIAPQRWLTSEVDSLSELIDDKFGRDTENAAWVSKYTSKDKVIKMAADRLKVSFLAGCARDLRIMYAAGSSNRVRTSVDHDRAEFMQSGFHLAKLDLLRNIVQSWESA
jgi:hypothetical protein